MWDFGELGQMFGDNIAARAVRDAAQGEGFAAANADGGIEQPMGLDGGWADDVWQTPGCLQLGGPNGLVP